MANLNKVMLMGNLTRDIEIRTLPNGTSVGQFGLAINRNWQDAQGEKKEEVTFVDCEAWSKTAEIMAKYLSKGRPVFVEGRLKLDSWDDKESGQKRSKLKVVVESFQFIDSKKDDGKASGEIEVKPSGVGRKPLPGGPPIDPSGIPFSWRGIDGF